MCSKLGQFPGTVLNLSSLGGGEKGGGKGGRQGMGRGFDIFQKFPVKFPTH